MAKRPQSGDVDIHVDRIFTRIYAPAPTGRPIFDGLCPEPYRNRPNSRRVATSTSMLTAYLTLASGYYIRQVIISFFVELLQNQCI